MNQQDNIMQYTVFFSFLSFRRVLNVNTVLRGGGKNRTCLKSHRKYSCYLKTQKINFLFTSHMCISYMGWL